MTEQKFSTPAEVLAFMFAGNATFTYRSLRTDARYTYKVQEGEKRNPSDPTVFFVKVLTGPDNTSDYTYIGMIKGGKFSLTKASKMKADSTPVQTFSWALAQFQKSAEMPAQLEVWHIGRCGRCGRELTVPESIASGIGPDCAAQMRQEQVRLTPANPNLPKEKPVKVERTAPRNAAPARNTSSVDAELDARIREAIAEYRSNAPENYYQDGMLDEKEAFQVAYNKFRLEFTNDDRYLGSKFGELEREQEARAFMSKGK